MRKIIIMALISIAAREAIGAFGDGQPFANATNVPTWHEALRLYDPAVELWTRLKLIHEIRFSTNLNEQYSDFETVTIPVHLVNTQSVVGDVTNTWGVYSNHTFQFHPVGSDSTNYDASTDFASNSIQTIAFSYFGTNVEVDLRAGLLRYIPRFLYSEGDEVYDVYAGLGGFVSTSPAPAAYFVLTDSNGDTPTEPAKQSLAGIMSRQSFGFTFNVETNEFGEFVTGHGSGSGFGGLFSDRVTMAQEGTLLVAEMVATNASAGQWEFRDYDVSLAELQRLYDESIRPILTYTRLDPSVGFSTVNVVIEGRANKIPYEIGASGGKTTIVTNETVTISAATAACTFQWQIDAPPTDMLTTTNTTANNGDYISLVYTNILTLPRYANPEDIAYLYPTFIDDLWRLMKELQWIQPENSRWVANGQSNVFEWSGSSTSSFVAAQAAAATNATISTLNDERPTQWARGSKAAGLFTAEAKAVKSLGTVTKTNPKFSKVYRSWMRNNIPVDIQSHNGIWDDQSESLTQEGWDLLESSPSTNAPYFTNVTETGNVTFPPNWPGSPNSGATGRTARGWGARTGPTYIAEWDDLAP